MEIFRDHTVWGQMQVKEEHGTVTFIACGQLPQYGEILRVWGIRDGQQPLLIGVAEPDGEQLKIERSLSTQYLKSLGYYPTLPTCYAAGTKPPSESNYIDPLLQAVLQEEQVSGEQKENYLHITCVFQSDRPFPLAFIGCCCTVTDGQAQLIWDRKTGCPVRPDSL